MTLLTSLSKFSASELFRSVLAQRTDLCGHISDAGFRTMILLSHAASSFIGASRIRALHPLQATAGEV